MASCIASAANSARHRSCFFGCTATLMTVPEVV
jgi:hypothetical protein